MSKLNFFLDVARSQANQKGVVEIKDLTRLFPGKSKSYINTNLFLLKGKGLVKKISPGKWMIFPILPVEEKKDEKNIDEGPQKKPERKGLQLRTLVLTPEEKLVLDLLTEVQIKCPDKSIGPRFAQGGVIEVLQSKGISDVEWSGLKKKLLDLKIIQTGGIGKKGQIFNLDQDLLLEYLTNESLIKTTLWREGQVRDRLKIKISNLKDRARQIDDIQQEIQKNLADLELAKMEVEDLEKRLSGLEKRLKAEFSDKEKVLSFQELLKGIEHLGEDATINFFKEILGE